jgi:hypothetical protein
MPFVQRPEGFSSETLELLDSAIMGLWLDHAAGVVKAERVALELKAVPARSARGGLLVYRARTRRAVTQNMEARIC